MSIISYVYSFFSEETNIIELPMITVSGSLMKLPVLRITCRVSPHNIVYKVHGLVRDFHENMDKSYMEFLSLDSLLIALKYSECYYDESSYFIELKQGDTRLLETIVKFTKFPIGTHNMQELQPFLDVMGDFLTMLTNVNHL